MSYPTDLAVLVLHTFLGYSSAFSNSPNTHHHSLSYVCFCISWHKLVFLIYVKLCRNYERNSCCLRRNSTSKDLKDPRGSCLKACRRVKVESMDKRASSAKVQSTFEEWIPQMLQEECLISHGVVKYQVLYMYTMVCSVICSCSYLIPAYSKSCKKQANSRFRSALSLLC